MSHTNSTSNYSLPQFLTSDKPAWLTDINNAFSDIDTGMHNAQTKANTADTNASQALLDAASASSAASAADAKGAGAVASLADTFQTTETYTVGELVIYNNLLYVCTTAVTDPGAWTGSTNWARATVEGFVNGKTASDIPLNSSVGAQTTEVACSYRAGDIVTFNYQQMFCRIDTSGTRISVFIPLSKIIPTELTVTAGGNYSVYFYDGSSLLSNHNISNDTQSLQKAQNGVILTITLTNALSQTLGYGAVELRNTFTLTFS